MCKVLEAAWRKGAKLDAWEEYFSWNAGWRLLMSAAWIRIFYANRQPGKG